ncbi:MAG: CBS domain-containing protein [Actinobacteria bacterium]|nr:CBS domain-containing protein [Actinomycetota bacterium]
MSELTVANVMSKDPLTIAPDASVTDAARLMVEERIGALPVIENGKLIGIVTEGDLIMQDVKLEFPTYLHLLDGFIMYPPATARFESELKKAVAANVRAVMTENPVTVRVDASLEEVATLLVEKDVSRLPVLDGDRLVGIISKSDVVRSLLLEQE